MIARPKIDHGKDFGTSQLVKENINAGQRIFILYCHRIEWTIVNTHLQTTIFLFHEQGGTPPRRRTWADIPFIKQFLQLIFQLS
jgi:hypothetical protein